MLAIVETHPIQYHAPVWSTAAARGVPLHVIYGSSFSVQGHRDPDFRSIVQWNNSLLEGYPYQFLPGSVAGPATDYNSVSTNGLADALRQLSPDALLCCGYTHPLDRRVLIEGWRLRLPILLRTEANDSACERTWIQNFRRDLVLRNVYRTISAFLSIGHEATNHYQRLGVPKHKIFNSPYAVSTLPFAMGEPDRHRLRSLTRRELGIESDAKVVLFSGKLSFRKGVDLLLQAIAELPDKLRPVLLLLGDGELREQLEHSTLPVRRIMVGFHPQDRLSPYFHAADMLALPSRHSETWGLVVNEALHHGLPAVVSDAVGSRHDLIHNGRTGEVCCRNDLASLTAALQRCLNYAGTIKTRSECRAAVANYSIEAAAIGLQQALEFCRRP
jgi:glycosyltransferase involved in cell wall biosynthesis